MSAPFTEKVSVDISTGAVDQIACAMENQLPFIREHSGGVAVIICRGADTLRVLRSALTAERDFSAKACQETRVALAELVTAKRALTAGAEQNAELRDVLSQLLGWSVFRSDWAAAGQPEPEIHPIQRARVLLHRLEAM